MHPEKEFATLLQPFKSFILVYLFTSLLHLFRVNYIKCI